MRYLPNEGGRGRRRRGGSDEEDEDEDMCESDDTLIHNMSEGSFEKDKEDALHRVCDNKKNNFSSAKK